MKTLLFLFLLLPTWGHAETKITGAEINPSASVVLSSLTIVGGGITGISNSSATVISSSYTVNNTTFAGNTCVYGSTISLTTNGGAVLAGYSSTIFTGSPNLGAFLGVKVDGVSISSKGIFRTNIYSANTNNGVAFTRIITGLAAGTHTFCVDAKYQTAAYALNWNGSTVDLDTQFWVMELK